MSTRLSRSARAVMALLVASGVGAAQSFSVTALATPQPRVSATGLGTTTRTLPVGSVTAPQSISVSASTLLWDLSTATLSVTPGTSEVTIAASAGRTGIISGMPSYSSVEGAFDLDLGGPVQGSLWIGYRMAADVPPTFRVDVGADGVPELDFTGAGRFQTGSFAIPVASAGPLRTRVEFHFSSAVAGSTVVSGVDLSIGFVPRDAVVFRDGLPGCSPLRPVPVLSGRDTPSPLQHRLDFGVDRAVPNGRAVLVFGTETDVAPLPIPPGCALLVEPVAWITLPVDAAGRATFRFDLFRPFPTTTIYMQALTFGAAPDVISSNRLDVILAP